jgi:hypothetical protein
MARSDPSLAATPSRGPPTTDELDRSDDRPLMRISGQTAIGPLRVCVHRGPVTTLSTVPNGPIPGDGSSPEVTFDPVAAGRATPSCGRKVR